MKKRISFFLTLLMFSSGLLFAQDTLPKFSLRNVGNKRIVVGWVNKFESVKQISIQRSFDSLRNFRSILTVADPTSPENGYVDTKATTDSMFYRLYIQLDNGVFLFSASKRPQWDTATKTVAGLAGTETEAEARLNRLQRPGNNGVNLTMIPTDSAGVPVMTTDNRPKADRWVASKYVYTVRDGYIRITLPDAGEKKYDIRFFTMENEAVFEMKDVKQKNFKIDKTNFYRSGWFKFELYEDGELKEKNRFFLPKEF